MLARSSRGHLICRGYDDSNLFCPLFPLVYAIHSPNDSHGLPTLSQLPMGEINGNRNMPAVKVSRRRPNYPKVRQLAMIHSAELVFTSLLEDDGATVLAFSSALVRSRCVRVRVRIPVASAVSTNRSSAPYPGCSFSLSSSSPPHWIPFALSPSSTRRRPPPGFLWYVSPIPLRHSYLIQLVPFLRAGIRAGDPPSTPLRLAWYCLSLDVALPKRSSWRRTHLREFAFAFSLPDIDADCPASWLPCVRSRLRLPSFASVAFPCGQFPFTFPLPPTLPSYSQRRD